MTIKYFSKMLMPDVEIIVCKENAAVSKIKASNVSKSKYAESTIKDFTMSSSRPMVRVDI